jgi:HK97 family phage major capsid protein
MDELVAEFKAALGELRRRNEAADSGTAEAKQAIARVQERVDSLEAAIKRAPGSGGGGEKGDAYSRAFYDFVRNGKAGMSAESKATLERKTLVGGTTAGDILVPEDLWAGVIRDLPKFTPMRGLVTVRPTNSDRIRKRTLTELSMQWGSWENSEASPSFSDATPAESFIYVEDLYGITKIGENEMADNDVQLESILTDSFARAGGEALDTAIVAGAGHASNEPEGILNASGITSLDAGQVAAVKADDMIALPYSVGSQYRANGRYIVAGTTEKAMRLLKDANDQYLWQPSLQAGTPASFNGYPVTVQDDVPAIPASGTAAKVAIFGDPRSGYALVERSGMTVQRLVELYAEAGEVGFKAHLRVGGGVIRAKSFAFLNVPAS